MKLHLKVLIIQARYVTVYVNIGSQCFAVLVLVHLFQLVAYWNGKV